MPLQNVDGFLVEVNKLAGKGAKVVFVDNLYVKGSSHPIASRDEHGNRYQERKLADGTKHKVLKNFPSRDFIHSKLQGRVSRFELLHLQYYWLLEYDI